VDRLTTKIDAITGVYDDLHEKMHEIDKTRKNNLVQMFSNVLTSS
jgi:hypothetical protein